MQFDLGIFLAALGITLLELTEASAVGLALHAESGKYTPFLAVSLGVLVVFIPTAIVGKYISLLPVFYVRLIAGVLLLYFGVRLTRSARRSYIRSKQAPQSNYKEEFERGVLATGFSVGVVEAFEAAIVLVALLPNSYGSTLLGLLLGVALVVAFTYALRFQVRKVKQATVKMVVSALLLTFATFWFAEEAVNIPDFILIPLFLIYLGAVRWVSTRSVLNNVLNPKSPQTGAHEN
ncbi:MAG: hypothetical protein QW514_04075 [Thermoprotei archaeon]